ncbi:MAG: TIGR03086 family protein [Geodermatophilaceae bacterium]|nr:TIGR03086 family protein [Geodermatophilaceae bacterium]MDQ3475925.1 TIGR03086 family metal-binding protein [Actinomycetota bacterium]
MTVPDLRELHARVVRASVSVVARVSTGDLARATPCGDWQLSDLLAHMTVQHDGFAAAAAGNGGDISLWAVQPFGPASISEYAAAADRVLTAFAEDGVLGREFALPEISPVTTFPGSQAIRFHLVDYVVHGWDVARAIDVPFSLDPDLLDTGLKIAQSVPDGPERLRPGAAFAPGVATAEGAPILDRIVALLGRDPTWTRVHSGRSSRPPL